jgi:hypothetical protein
MEEIFEILLPAKIDNTIRGTKIPFYIFALYAIVSTVRSCIHLLSPDGGAGTIAGMDLCLRAVGKFPIAFCVDPTARSHSLPVTDPVHVVDACAGSSSARTRWKNETRHLCAYAARSAWQSDHPAVGCGDVGLVIVE